MPTRKPRKPKPKALTLAQRQELASAGYEYASGLARSILVARLEEIKATQEAGEDVDYWGVCQLIRSLKDVQAIEAEALSLHYLDSNRAIAKVQQLGFLVTAPDGTIDVEARYVQD